MGHQNSEFRHESLQDTDSIQGLIKAINKGLSRGKLQLSDDDESVLLEPDGLINLKVTARRDGSEQRLSLRLSWHAEKDLKDKKILRAK